MKLDGWLLVQSFLLPEARERLPILYRSLSDTPATVQIMKERILWVQSLVGRKLALTKQDYVDLILFLDDHRVPLLSRAHTLMLRQKE